MMTTNVDDCDVRTIEESLSSLSPSPDVLRTWHGASLIFDERDRQLYHVHPSQRLDVQRPVRLYRFPSDPGLALLFADGGVNEAAGSIIALVCVEDTDRDWFRIVRPADSFRLSVVIGSEEHDIGGIGFHEPTSSVRERFYSYTVDAPDPSLPDDLRLLQGIPAITGSLRSVDGLTSITRRLPSLLPDLLSAISTETLRGMVPALTASTTWPQIFPELQRRLSDGQPTYPRATRELMRDKIDQWEWEIGEYSYGEPIVLDGEKSFLTIGRFCSIAGNVTIVLGNHTTRTTTSFPFASLRRQWPTAAATQGLEDHVAAPVSIGSDVWIGFGAIILPGTNIGHGAVIGANAVVRGEVAPYSIIAGNPARCVRKRFDEDTIARLLKICWWDWPADRVDRFIPFLLDSDVSRFLDAAERDPA